jgi:WhiB family redox-sensing transcriptional regulator
MTRAYTTPPRVARLVTSEGTQWQSHGVCRHEDPDLFFPAGSGGEFHGQIEEAKAVCRRCPVLTTCLEDALDDPRENTSHGQHGIRAALTPAERQALKTRTEATAA